MKRIFALSIFIFIADSGAYGQFYTNENMNWAFGSGSGVSFTSGVPVAISTGISAHEGCASVSDSAGNILFYTNGQIVYDRTGAIMPSGGDIVSYSTLSTTQGAAIVPVIGNNSRYYLFSLEENGVLAWSIADMTLHGGYGDVVAASMGTTLADSLSEKMTVIAGNNCDIWVLAHHLGGQKFLAFDVTATGINPTPVVSLTGTFTDRASYFSGVIKGSPDRKKIVAVCELGTELYDFDPNTGIVSNCQVLGNDYSYGAEFSPDNTKLYIGEQSPYDSVFQYDISLSTTPAIIASKTGIAGSWVATDIKLAPDNKIYMNNLADFASPYLDCIDSPNIRGKSCDYVAQAVHLTSPGYIGLPNLYVSFSPVSAGVITGDTVVCMRHTVTLSDAAPGGVWSGADSFNIVSGACQVTAMKYGQDTFLYIVSNGCVSDTAMHIITVQECAEFLQVQGVGASGSELHIFPNPAHSELNISAPYTIRSVSISNLLGQQVFSNKYNTGEAHIDIADLPYGTYFIKINGTEIRRFTKQ